MKRNCLVWMAVLASMVLFSTAGCKKAKKETPSKPGPAPTEKPDEKPEPPKPAGLFDPGAIDKVVALPMKSDPTFAKVQKQLVTVAEACRKESKYLHSLTWCKAWKPFNEELKKLNEALDPNEPKTIKPAMAATMAAVSKLKDESSYMRYTALKVLDRTFYDFSYRKFRVHRALLARAVANLVKDGKAKDERVQALRLLGIDGGLSHFNGDVYDGEVLAWAAQNDKEGDVRSTAMGHLAACVRKIGDKCPVKPDQLREWMKTEKHKDAIEGIGRLAGLLKMGDEVEAWCGPRLLDSTLYWGCFEGYKLILDKGRFDKFLALSEKYRDGEKSKTKSDFRLGYTVELMMHGFKKGFPRDKVVAYLDSVLEQEPTKTTRQKALTKKCLEALVKVTTNAEEAKATLKLVLKHQKKFKKAWNKDKERKEWLGVFATPLTALTKKALLDKK